MTENEKKEAIELLSKVADKVIESEADFLNDLAKL